MYIARNNGGSEPLPRCRISEPFPRPLLELGVCGCVEFELIANDQTLKGPVPHATCHMPLQPRWTSSIHQTWIRSAAVWCKASSARGDRWLHAGRAWERMSMPMPMPALRPRLSACHGSSGYQLVQTMDLDSGDGLEAFTYSLDMVYATALQLWMCQR